MSESCLSEWTEVYSVSLPHERIIKAGFLSSARAVCLNKDKKDSMYYNEKFQFGPEVRFCELECSKLIIVHADGTTRTSQANPIFLVFQIIFF